MTRRILLLPLELIDNHGTTVYCSSDIFCHRGKHCKQIERVKESEGERREALARFEEQDVTTHLHVMQPVLTFGFEDLVRLQGCSVGVSFMRRDGTCCNLLA